MIKLNNKGQSLVMFIMILPILLLLFIIVGDIGNVMVNKQEMDNVNYLVIEYGLEHINELNVESRLVDMIVLNDIELNEISIDVSNGKINVITKKHINGMLAKGFKIFSVESRYVGYIENGKKIIERVWDYG